MQKIITTQGLPDGHYDAPDTSTAIHERIDNRLTACYRQDYGDDIRIVPALTYQVADGQVTMIQLTYTIDHPTPARLENFREACEIFFCMLGFSVNTEDIPCVIFRATDIFCMATLIHALDYLSVSLESVLCPVDAALTPADAIFSPSGSYILQIPNVPHYRIPEGTLCISPAAARHCTQLQTLDIPAGMLFDDQSLTEYPQRLKVRIWDTRYDGTPLDDDCEEDSGQMPVFDEHGVGYTPDGKTLVACRYTFTDTHYRVPDGVLHIDDFAFISCRHWLQLSAPRSVQTIGDSIFGNGGIIHIR